MDGTICDSNNNIPAENIAALRACREAGIHIAVLTGRRRNTLAPQLELLYHQCEPRPGTPWLAATNSGGLLWEYPGWLQHSACVMDRQLAQQLLQVLEPSSVNCYVNPASSGGRELVHLRRTASPQFDRYFARFGHDALHLSDAQQLLDFEITQFAVPADDHLVYELAARVQASFNSEVLSVMTMRWPLLGIRALEVYRPESNKAAALTAIAAALNVSREDVVAVGDDQNDLPMLRWASLGAAMPHSTTEVIAASDLHLAGSGVGALAPWLESLLSASTPLLPEPELMV
jgi:Cof subfamily protein (haloacid dehalogenase superfamily)